MEHYLQNLQRSDVSPRAPLRQQISRSSRESGPATIIVMGLKGYIP